LIKLVFLSILSDVVTIDLKMDQLFIKTILVAPACIDKVW